MAKPVILPDLPRAKMFDNRTGVMQRIWQDFFRSFYSRIGGDTNDAVFNSVTANVFYIGDAETDGSWRLIISGDNLNFERRESSAWVRKGDVRP